MSLAGPFEPQEWSLSKADLDRPNIARIYDYVLGGKDNFATDRAVGDRIKQAVPEVWMGVREQRAVLRRAVRHLVGDLGLTQLIDVGAGLPSAGNVHEVAREVAPETRVAYVDHDPVVLAHGRALLVGDARARILPGDLRNPEAILACPALNELIDLDRPVGLVLCGILHYIPDAEEPARLLRTLADRLVPGSAVFVHHLVAEDLADDPEAAAMQQAFRDGIGRGEFRTPAQVAAMLEGLPGYAVEEPGVVHVPRWRPDPDTPSLEEHPVLRMAVAASAVKQPSGA